MNTINSWLLPGLLLLRKCTIYSMPPTPTRPIGPRVPKCLRVLKSPKARKP